MNPVDELHEMGLGLRLSPSGNLTLDGLKKLSPEQRKRALEMAREEKPRIVDTLKSRAIPPDPAALAYARSLLVKCPAQGKNLHCWWCSRCSGMESDKCKAWHIYRDEVEFFKRSDAPYSFALVEEVTPLQ
jgi:hypothetical protein